MHRLVPVFLICCIIPQLHAQPAKAVFDHYGTEQGFSTRTSRTVVKTSQGMIWITTDDGLVRFDSETFRFYRHDPADSQSIASNLTDEMVTDIHDRLWIVTGAGLDRFDPATGVFTHCLIREEGKDKFDFRPEALFYDRLANRVWVGTWQGLFYTENGETVLRRAKADPSALPYLQMTFNTIAGDKQGFLWLGNTYGFFRYEPLTGRVTRFHIPGQDDKLEDDDGVFTLYAGERDVLWIGTWNKGLVRFDIRSGKAERFYYSDHTREQNGVVAITSTGLPTEKDVVWISSVNMGLGTFNYATRTFSFYGTAQEKDKYGIKGRTNRLLPTATEGMWIAAEDGLHRYDYAKQLFREIDLVRLNPELRKSLPVEFVCFFPSASGKDSLCYFNVPYVGPLGYDLVNDRMAGLPAALRKYFSGSVFAMYIDAARVLWLSTDQYGLVGYSLVDRELVLPEKKYFTGQWKWVTGFFEDRDQRLWLATYEGLYMLDRQRQQVIALEVVNKELARSGLSRHIRGMDQDPQGRIWFSTGGGAEKAGAIGCYDEMSARPVLFDHTHHKNQGFPPQLDANNIVCSGQEVFVATGSGLLRIRLKGNQPSFQLLTMREGLSNDRIESVAKDRLGNIWCATVFGVSCYLPARHFFINYFSSSSNLGPAKMPAMTVSRQTGFVYLSQSGALNYFDPGEVVMDPPPALVFTGLQVFNKEYNGSLLSGKSIRLRYDENMLTVRFAALSYRNAENNQYAYRLKGLETEWNYTKDHVASYSNLAPGTYTLQVRAANHSGVWTSQPVELIFSIRPPFWKTGWFIVLCVLSLAAVAYVVVRVRVRAIRERYALRNKIAADLHDEIGSTLTSIHILSSVSQQALDRQPGKAREMLEQISSQSQMIQQSMSDIVWAIRPDNDKVENLLVRMREYAARTLEPLNIRTLIFIGDELLPFALSLQARKELLLIFKEAVNNIARHSGASAAEISLKKEGGTLSLVIHDNGTWKEGSQSGTGSRSMRQRAQSLGGELQCSHDASGTTVTAKIPLT